jgi:hypothetical protein
MLYCCGPTYLFLKYYCGKLSVTPRPSHVGFLADNVALGQGFLRIIGYSPAIIIPLKI